MLNYKLHEQIKKLREARRFSQVELGKRLGVTKACICNWENDNAQPSVEMLVRLASFFSVSTDYMLGFEPGEYIDVTGLPDEVIAHVRQIVEDLKASEKKD
ncbi:MAG: helix-turn-helix transcriptional regulator [Oscillospiraceae bacterium]|nr:helix-turn-helix transcriptional regulator [Oscillospiraceae bacterium]